ncbi:flagellar assembly peptidoglycan hydrolase FlgJ [Kushneria aurantia]|uniref:Peptidoglycan hydrolase FlgJ n=1 Tax=Kushneria aurantia TaxID=504092 RepID=A0ABV6G0Y5_9GAMM|nr:flagellar assembly peptidoglycan hydrolase FlgJ [Kushneria aurantia]
MSIDNARGQFALDVRGMTKLRHSAGRDPQGNLKETAQQFESLFLQKMLKSMRDAIPKSDLLESDSLDQYTDMMDRQWAQHLSGQGFGLSKMLVQQLSKGEGSGEQSDPLQQLRAESRPLDATSAVPLSEQHQAYNRELQRAAQRPSAGGALIEGYRPLDSDSQADESGSGSLLPGHQRLIADVAPHVANFVSHMGDAARAVSERTGISDRLILAQAALESGWGGSEIRNENGSSSHNLFGIKATGGWQGERSHITTTEYENGRAMKVRDDFRAYDSYEAAFSDYARLLTDNPRYRQVLEAETPEAAAHALQNAGYATDPRYADKLVAIMTQLPDMRSPMGESLFTGSDSNGRQQAAARAYAQQNEAMASEASRIF